MKNILLRIKTKIISAYKRLERLLFGIGISVFTTLAISTPAFAATDIWSWLDTALSDLYNKFLSVSTDRAVATSRAWLKRILISWIILNTLGFVMTYLIDLTSGGRFIATP